MATDSYIKIWHFTIGHCFIFSRLFMNCLSQNTKSTSVHFTSLITKRKVYPILREESFMLGEKMDILLKLNKTQLSRLANKYLCVTVIDYICK